MGSVYRPKYKRKDGTIAESAVWWVKFYQDGRPIRLSTETDKETEAKKFLKDKEGGAVRGEPILPRANRVRFDELLDDVVRNYRIKGKRSLATLERRIKLHVRPFFGVRRAATISTADIEAYIDKRQTVEDEPADGKRPKRPASNAEINRELAIVKRGFSLALKCTPPKVLFKPHVPMLAEDNVRQGFLDDGQLADVLKHLPVPVRPVIRFAYETAWRINSEVLPLTWARVDFTSETIRLDVGTTKNKRGRVVKFTAALRELLTAQRAYTDQVQREQGRVIPHVFHRAGAPIRYFRRSWITACRKAGLPGRIPHDLRRSGIRRFVRAGISQTVAMQISGHKTAEVFRRYDITSESDLADAARRLDEAAEILTGKVTGKVTALA